ncbi:MAG: hypothetical protein V1690_00265 [Candidatus Moraniibacteriota bacterium]
MKTSFLVTVAIVAVIALFVLFPNLCSARGMMMGHSFDDLSTTRNVFWVEGKNAELLPEELKRFVEEAKIQYDRKKREYKHCEEFSFFWNPSPSESVPKKVLWLFKTSSKSFKELNESTAFKVRVEIPCYNKYRAVPIRVPEKKISDYSLLPILSETWHELVFTAKVVYYSLRMK